MINCLGTFPSLPFYGGAFPRPPFPIPWTPPPIITVLVIAVIVLVILAIIRLTDKAGYKEGD